MISGTLQRLKDFFLPEGSPHNLGIFRILFGIYLLLHLSRMVPFIPDFLSVEGSFLPLFDTWTRPLDPMESFFAQITNPASVGAAYGIFFTMLGALVLFTVGIWARFAALLFCLTFIYHYFIFFYFTEASYDKVNLIIMAILVFSPCDEAWSIKSWIRNRRGLKAKESYPLWTQRLICLEIASVYLGAALYKTLSGAWNGGEVIYTALMADWTSPLSFWLARQGLQMGWYDILLLMVIFFEFTAWFMLFDRRYQKLWMIGGIIFHLSNAALLNIWAFLNFPLTYGLFLTQSKDR